MSKTRSRTKTTSVGIYGHGMLAMLYRYGALTHAQIERLGAFSPSAVDRQLRPLMRSGRVVKAGDKTLWDAPATGAPKALYHLSVPTGARAGARALGEENDRSALRDYRRIQLPDTAVHRVQANEYLISLQFGSPGGVEVPFSEVFAESNPGFPLFGTGRPKSDRKDAPYRFSTIVPDGVFALDSGGQQHYYVELESELRKKHVLLKIRDYLGRWRRLVRPNVGEVRFHDPAHVLEPLVVLSRTPADHEKLRSHLMEAVPELEDYPAARDALSEASGGTVSPLEMVLLAPYEAAVSAPHGQVYRTLEAATFVEPQRVSLADAAGVAGRMTVPPKKDARERAKAEQEAAEKAKKDSEKEG